MDLTGKKFDLVGTMLGTTASPDRAVTAPEAKPKPGEATGPQNPLSALPLLWGSGGGLIPGMTGSTSTSFPFGGWGGYGASPLFPGVPLSIFGSFFGWAGSYGITQPRKGSYWTYRLMDLNPTLALVRALIFNPILASQWVVRPSAWASDMMPKKQPEGATRKPADIPKWRKNLDPLKLENAVNLVRDQITPTMRRDYLGEASRYTSFGWRGFEKVWSVRDGFYWFDKAKSLLPDWTQILHDGAGTFAGLSQSGIDGEPLGCEKSMIVTYNGEAGNLYGLPRHETAYDTWTDWQSTRLREALYEGKMSGRLPKLHYRPGMTEMPPGSGKFVDNAVIAQQILSTVVEGRGVALPDLQYEDAQLINNPKLAGLGPWVLEIEDAGSNSDQLKGFQSIMEYKDKLLVRSWCWPERAVLEGQRSASRADSEQHTDSASADREGIDNELANQFSANVGEDIVTLNFGPDYRGAVEIQPAPLVDQKVVIYSKILEAILGNTTVAPEVLAECDLEEVFDHLDIETQPGSALNERMKTLAQTLSDQRDQKSQQASIAGTGGANGNGKNGNGKVNRPAAKALLSRLGWNEED